MGYAIIRIQKLKSGQAVRRSMKHAFREQETPNADESRIAENTNIGAHNVSEALEKFNLRLPEKVRSNAVLAVEYLITASPEDMHAKSRQEQDAYFGDALKWLETKHGKENIVYAGIHRDETTPHMYAYVVPIDARGKLNCRAFLGEVNALTQIQTDFAQEVGQQHGLQRGIEKSKARHIPIQQYYARVNKAFEPLPEVKTPVPKLREEPEKPGLFAGKDAKEEWKNNHDAWEIERAAAQIQRQQHMAEVKARQDAAVETAKRHEAQAKEAAALKDENLKLKQSNSHYVDKSSTLAVQTKKLLTIAQLFTPEEIRAGVARRQQQEEEKIRQSEIASQKAAEATRLADIKEKEMEKLLKIEVETANRVQGLQKLLQCSGAIYNFAVNACKAISDVGNNPKFVKWIDVEARTVFQAIGEHGQSPESVIDAITRYSPGRSDPSSHQTLRDSVYQIAPDLIARFENSRAQNNDSERDNDMDMDR